MIIHYQNIDNNSGYHGVFLENTEMTDILSGPTLDSLLDREVIDERLKELTGLLDTGFCSENLLADIQAFENPEPADLRDWRIGEALAEVILAESFHCRFHWNELRDARNPRGNKTGADLVGFIEVDGNVLFLFGEVKTSSEKKSPPQVMTKADDGIEKQLKDLYSTQSKRQILVTYLKSKTLNLADDHQFKKDYNIALRSYYGAEHYQLIGVLIRDVDHDEIDVSISYNRIKTTILNPVGLKLIALYTSIESTNWHKIIKGSI